MPDNDIGGHFRILLRVCRSAAWREIWEQLGVGVESFSSLSLPQNATDCRIWIECQRREIVLITGNRNAFGKNSLETTIRELCSPTSLPVFTISQPGRVHTNREYAELVAMQMMEKLTDIELLRGTGRIYLP